MNIAIAGALLISAMVATSSMAAVTTTVVDVPTRGVTQRFLYVHPDAPAANIIVLPGGDGILGIQNDGTMTTVVAACSLFGRNRQAFADHGFALALVDEASDGFVWDFSDMLEVIRYMQARANVPTWVTGGSMATFATSNLAANLLIDMPVGAIFWSPASPNLRQVALIRRPTFVIYHPLDTGQSGPAFFAALTSAPVKEIASLIGGRSAGCFGYHLFNGLDAEFVAATADFIDKYNDMLEDGSPQTTVAVEYYYDVWDFYFETSFPDEIAALDAGAFGGAWKRTGQTFKVWPSASSASAVPTCRFFSTIFSPKSSHFYTPVATECAGLKAGQAWQYEAIAFYIQSADDNGLCTSGMIALYRLYNNGMGGAPNHRYTTSLTILNQMLAAGWLFEGNGNTMVFACVPQ